jgi:hypothetical protein
LGWVGYLVVGISAFSAAAFRFTEMLVFRTLATYLSPKQNHFTDSTASKSFTLPKARQRHIPAAGGHTSRRGKTPSVPKVGKFI